MNGTILNMICFLRARELDLSSIGHSRKSPTFSIQNLSHLFQLKPAQKHQLSSNSHNSYRAPEVGEEWHTPFWANPQYTKGASKELNNPVT